MTVNFAATSLDYKSDPQNFFLDDYKRNCVKKC